MKEVNLKLNIRELLLQCLEEVPVIISLNDVHNETESHADIAIEVVTDRENLRLNVAVRSNGQPRYAREAVALLMMQSGSSTESAYSVFAAPFISKAAAEICRETGAGYIDLAGNCLLAFDGIYIERQGRPNRFVSRRSLKSLYETRSSRVLRALLFDPDLQWKLTDLSEASGVSIGQVYNVKKALVDREWAEFDHDGLKLTRPERVLRDWGKHYTCDRNDLFHFRSAEPPEELEARLTGVFSEKRLRYALTSFSASARLVTNPRRAGVYAYVDSDVDRAAGYLRLESTDTEPGVTLMRPHDEGVFFGMVEIAGFNVVSPIQAYLDMVGLEEKDPEEAETLFREVIHKGWQHSMT